ncbi:MAG TPA: hypothetical protein VHQ90_14540 [Thermoanaerobaculia bacterium]|nr:hypothetical protein [Thermoanaerobaculia bacterium]
MRKASASQDRSTPEMLPEYRFDYTKAKPNRFARSGGSRVVVVLDPDISEVFKTPESVNTVLRALITTMPRTQKE